MIVAVAAWLTIWAQMQFDLWAASLKGLPM
jgi:hypothetical protein